TGTALTDAAQKQGFDPAFIALVNFPDVLAMMADHIDDYAAIGQAFSADQASVTDSIQRLRAQAYASGALRSNSQQQVEVQQPAGQTIYVIQPANPQVVYVPLYDPTVVYIQPSNAVVATSLISFGVGIGIGAVGRILIVRRTARTVRDRLCGPTGQATAAIGAIVHPTIGLRIVLRTGPGTAVLEIGQEASAQNRRQQSR